MARRFPEVVRAFEQKRTDCPDEPDFQELYEVLGDRAAQEAIRSKTPEVRHCELLLMSPNACKGCKNNPHEGENLRARELAEMNVISIEKSFTLLSDLELGLLKIELLDPFEVTLLRIMHEHQVFKRQEIQAKLIAAQVSKLF